MFLTLSTIVLKIKNNYVRFNYKINSKKKDYTSIYV